jgi:hypothetical protein
MGETSKTVDHWAHWHTSWPNGSFYPQVITYVQPRSSRVYVATFAQRKHDARQTMDHSVKSSFMWYASIMHVHVAQTQKLWQYYGGIKNH